MRHTTTSGTSIHKVRRRALGDKRARGHEFQRRGRRIRRADPSRIRRGATDGSLTGVSGLVPFGMFLERLGVPSKLRRWFGHIKDGRGVVYPMDAQLRLLLDANVVGEGRVFGLEALGDDPLFVQLAGGSVPSVDTVYRDLCRLDEMELAKLELVVAEHGLAELRRLAFDAVHLDVDTTVEPLFGHQEGALPGLNPRYQGRPSYHPLLGCVAETRSVVGAVLRPGDRGFGGEDAESISVYIDRVRAAVGPDCRLVVRIDAAGDCTEILDTINGRAEIEPVIGELKSALAIGKVPSQSFNANHAAFLIKLLAHNLVRRYVLAAAPAATTWRIPWLRRALFLVPARLVQSGRQWTLRVPPKSALLDAFARLE